MKIDYLIIADSAQITADNRLWILGGESARIRAAALPHKHMTITLAMRLVWSTSDDDAHEVWVDFLDPNGVAVVAPTRTTVLRSKASVGADDEYNQPMTLTYLQLVFKEAGRYSFHVKVDGIELAKRSLVVFLV